MCFRVFLPQPEESCAIEFRIPPNVIVCVRVKRLTGLVTPDFLRLIFAFEVYRSRIPVGLLARDVVASFKQRDALTQRSEHVAKRSPAGASAGDDEIELFLSNQVSLP